MKIFQPEFELTWEQINDIYNHLTDDAKCEVTFERFEDLIKVLDHKRQVTQIEGEILELSKAEVEVLTNNSARIDSITSRLELLTFLRQVSQDNAQSSSPLFSYDTVDLLWDKLELNRECSSPLQEILPVAVINDSIHSSNELVKQRSISIGSSDETDELEQLKRSQLQCLDQLMSACTAVQQIDGSKAVCKLAYDLMVFGENFHKGLEEIQGIIGAKNKLIAFVRSQSDQLRHDIIDRDAKLEELVQELSMERSQNGDLTRNIN